VSQGTNLHDKVGDDASIVRMHAGSVRVEDAGHADVDAWAKAKRRGRGGRLDCYRYAAVILWVQQGGGDQGGGECKG
jgi:hypothetical protein